MTVDDVEIKVQHTRSGGRRVVVTIPLERCIPAAGFVGADVVERAGVTAMEVAMHALAEALGFEEGSDV